MVIFRYFCYRHLLYLTLNVDGHGWLPQLSRLLLLYMIRIHWLLLNMQLSIEINTFFFISLLKSSIKSIAIIYVIRNISDLLDQLGKWKYFRYWTFAHENIYQKKFRRQHLQLIMLIFNSRYLLALRIFRHRSKEWWITVN